MKLNLPVPKEAQLETMPDGVRSSPAAASRGIFKPAGKSLLCRFFHVAAPEDGRTPQKADARQRRAGWTLLEMMVSIGAGMLILGALGSVFIFMNRNLDSTANYEELDRQSRNAVDVMSRDIRAAAALTSYATNTLSFTNQDGTLLQYTWDTTNKLTYTNATVLNGGPYGGTLLKSCTYLDFSIFQHNPSNGSTMDFWPTTNPALAKVVLINFVCSRTNYTTLKNTESVQTAKIVMRN